MASGRRPAFEIVTTRSGNQICVDIRGELDLSTHEQLRVALCQVELRGADRVHLLLSGLEFCDLGGVELLVAFAIRARDGGCSVATYGASPMIRKMARLIKVEETLTIS